MQVVASAREVVLDLLEGLVLRLRQTDVEVQSADDRDRSVEEVHALLAEARHQHWIRLDDGEDEEVGAHGGEAAGEATYLNRIDLADHDPRDDEEAEGARDRVAHNADHRDPRVIRQLVLDADIGTETEHRYAATDRRDEGHGPTAESPAGDAGGDGRCQPDDPQQNCDQVLVQLDSGLGDYVHSVEGHRVGPRPLVDEEVEEEQRERLERVRLDERLEDLPQSGEPLEVVLVREVHQGVHLFVEVVRGAAELLQRLACLLGLVHRDQIGRRLGEEEHEDDSSRWDDSADTGYCIPVEHRSECVLDEDTRADPDAGDGRERTP